MRSRERQNQILPRDFFLTTAVYAYMTAPSRPRRHRKRRILLIVSLTVLILLGFGLSPSDEAAFRTFATAVDRWQANPEFRSIATEYCALGSRAVRTRPWGLPTGKIILAIRATPLLPRKYAVNPTSRLHYENFGRGPLVAYLHLCSEQSIGDVVGIVESVSRKKDRSAADLHQVLDAFKMDFPVTRDDGAMQSAESLVHDVQGGSFAIRGGIGDRLKPHIAALAQELHLNADPRSLDPDQQQSILERLDAYVRLHDQELWRTKQVSDFAGGVWAQVFGPPYNTLLVPFTWTMELSRVILVALLIVMVGRLLAARKDLERSRELSPRMDTDEPG